MPLFICVLNQVVNEIISLRILLESVRLWPLIFYKQIHIVPYKESLFIYQTDAVIEENEENERMRVCIFGLLLVNGILIYKISSR